MTPLQIIRQALQNGATLTLYHLDDGYHVEVSYITVDGGTAKTGVVDPRLDQAIAAVRRIWEPAEQPK